MKPEAPRYSPVPEEVIENAQVERRYQLKLLHDARLKQSKLPARKSDFLQGVWDKYQTQIEAAENRLRSINVTESVARKQLASEQQQQQQQHPFSSTSSSSASTSQPQQRSSKPLPPGLRNRVQPQETLASRSSLKRPVPPENQPQPLAKAPLVSEPQGEVDDDDDDDDDDDSSFSSPPSPPTFWRIGWAEAGALASRLMERRANMDP